MTELFADEHDAHLLRTTLLRVAASVGNGDVPNGGRTPPPVVDLRTAQARYRVRGTAYGTPRERQPLILVSLERLTPAMLSPTSSVDGSG